MSNNYRAGDEPIPGFRLAHFLGRGGMGEVWKATAPGGTEVAVKLISLASRQGLKEFQAVRLVKLIKHPNLVPIIAFWLKDENGNLLTDDLGGSAHFEGDWAGELILAMGLCEKSLADRLKECRKSNLTGIPFQELLGYMEDAAKAIDYLNQPVHNLGSNDLAIQHCDIKPLNILIVGGAAQVCDFGLARVLGDGHNTGFGASASYVAPELLANKPSQTTDQYSLAISYVELRTGMLPLQANNPAAALAAHIQGQLDLSRLPPAEQAIIKRATALKPEQRYPRTIDMVRALRDSVVQISQPKPAAPVKKKQIEALLVPGGEVVPGYKLIKLLGRGGYGEVWEATAPGGKHIALKIVRNLEAKTGKQEFKALEIIRGVDHNYLMELHAYWVLDSNCEIIPDEVRNKPNSPTPSILVIATRLANKNLKQRLQEWQAAGHAGIPIQELMQFMRQSAIAIDYLNAEQHELNGRKVSIQHRDIKPENILLAVNTVKVGDFGLAKVVEGTAAAVNENSTGLTIAYAAPEMLRGSVTRWTDQYALAVTYFQLRTGGMPFPPNSSINDVLIAHLQGALQLDKLEPGEKAVIAQATALTPEKRFGTSLEMVQALAHAIKAASAPAEADPAPSSVPTSTQPGKPHRQTSGNVATTAEQAVTVPAKAEGETAPNDQFRTLANPPAVDKTRPETRPIQPSPTKQHAQRGSPQTKAIAAMVTGQKPASADWKEPRKSSAGRKVLAVALLLLVGLGVAGAVFREQLMGMLGMHPSARTSPEVALKPSATESRPDTGSDTRKTTGPDTSKSTETVRPTTPQTKPDDRLPTLLAEISRQIDEGKFDGVNEQLKQAEKLASSPAAKLEVEVRRALFLARDPAGAKNRKQAADALKQVLARGNVPRQADLCLEYAKLAQAEPAFLADARTTLTLSLASISPDKKEQVQQSLRTLIAQIIKRQIPQMGKGTDWAKTLQDCRDAEPTAWVTACKVECLIERKAGKPDAGDLKEAKAAVESPAVKETGPYAHYVTALVLHASGRPDQAAKEVLEAGRGEAGSPILLEQRSGRAASILIDAAGSVRIDDATKPLAVPFKSAAEADQALTWINKAVALLASSKEPLPLGVRITRALAYGYQSKPDSAQAKSAIEELVKEPGLDKIGLPGCQLSLVLARSQPATTAGRLASLDAYLDVLDRMNKIGSTDDAAALDLYQLVLSPAIKTGTTAPAAELAKVDFKARLAQLHAGVGALVSDNLYANWPFKDAQQQVIQSYSDAIKLDGTKARYYVGRGSALASLPKADFAAISKDADKAIDLDPQLPPAHELRGYVIVLQAREQSILKQRATQFRQAIAAYDKALALSQASKNSDRELASVLTSRATACVELANSLTDRSEQSKFLQEARANAEKAIAMKDRRYPEYAYAVQGNSLEDIAMLLRENMADNYAAAVEAFTSALKESPNPATYRLSRGRAQYRRVALGGDDVKFLDDAANDLTAVLKESNKPTEKAEASTWLAKVFVQRGKLAEAEKNFEAAIDLAKGTPRLSLDHTLIWLRTAKDLLFGGKLSKEDQTRCLAAIRKYAREMWKKDKLPEAAYLLAQAFQFEGKLKEALAMYGEAVPLADVGKADFPKFSILLARASLLLFNTDAAIHKEFNGYITASKDAGRAVQLLKDGGLDTGSEAFTYGLSGMACAFALSESSIKDQATLQSLQDTTRAHLEKALELAPENPYSLQWRYYLAREYKRREEFDKAEKVAKEGRAKSQEKGFDATWKGRFEAFLKELAEAKPKG